MIIKLSTNYDHPLARQAPGGKAVWKDAVFLINQEVEECDAWIVHEGLLRPEATRCPKDSICFLTGEPPEIRTYDPAWLAAFSKVVTCHRDMSHPRRQLGQTALPWLVGRSFDQLAGSEFPEKESNLSVICSDKATIDGHRRRLAFVEQLLALMPAPRFGRGFTPLPDKWDGLAPYRYSVAVENSRHEHYWTEKIADCFLAGTVPIYWGDPTIHDYFPADAMIILETLDPVEAARIIRSEATAEAYERRLPALREARRLVLEDYNLFEVAHRLAKSCASGAAASPVLLSPERRLRGWRARLKRLFG